MIITQQWNKSAVYYTCTSGSDSCRCIGVQQTHSPGGSTLREMMSWPPSSKLWRQTKIRLRQSMRIYLKNNPAKFHPDSIWNDGALVFLTRSPQEEQQQQEITLYEISSWSKYPALASNIHITSYNITFIDHATTMMQLKGYTLQQ